MSCYSPCSSRLCLLAADNMYRYNATNDGWGRRAQVIIVRTKKRTSDTSLFSLALFACSCRAVPWHRVFSFTLPFLSLGRSVARSSFSRFPFAFELWRGACLPQRSIIHFARTHTPSTLRHANSITVLQCASSSTTRAARPQHNVFVHMRSATACAPRDESKR